MKKLLLALLLCAFAQLCAAQKQDTMCVFVVYIDSVKIFAGYPEYDIRVEVLPGWRVSRIVEDADEVYIEETFYDTNGVKFNPDVVLMYRKRKPSTNPFRQ
jgi:hypothetical protein